MATRRTQDRAPAAEPARQQPAAEDSRLADAEQALLDARAQILELEESLLSYRRSNAQLAQQNEELRERLAVLEAERGSVLSVAHDRTAELEAEIHRLRSLEPRLAEVEALKREALELRADRDRLAARVAELERGQAEMAAELEAARAEARELDQMCSAIDEARVALEGEVQNLRSRVQELAPRAERAAVLEAELEELRAARDREEEERRGERDAVETLQRQVREAVAAREELERTAAALRDEVARLEAALEGEREAARERECALQEVQDRAQKQAQEMREALERARGAAVTVEEERDRLREENARLLQAAAADLPSPERRPPTGGEVEALRKRLEAVERERDALLRQRDQLEHADRELRRRLEELEARLLQAGQAAAAAEPRAEDAQAPSRAAFARLALFDFGRTRERLAGELGNAGFAVLSPEGEGDADPRLPLFGSVNLADPRAWLAARGFRPEGRGRLFAYVLAPNAQAAFWLGTIRFARPEPAQLAVLLPRMVAGLARAAVLSDSDTLAADLCRRLAAAGVQAEGATEESVAAEMLRDLQPEIVLVAPSPACTEELGVLRALGELVPCPPVVFLIPDPAPPVQTLALSRGARGLLRRADVPPGELARRIADAAG